MATLLELVCKHVKVWPAWAGAVYQEPNGWLMGVHILGGDMRAMRMSETADDATVARVTKEQWLGYKMCHPDVQIAITNTPKFAPCPEICAEFASHMSEPTCAELPMCIPRTEYELLLASRQAWLQVMQAIDETHPDWAVGTTQGTLVERAIKAIKNDN